MTLEELAKEPTRLLGVKEVCFELKISRTTLNRWRRQAKDNVPNTKHFPEPDVCTTGHPQWQANTLMKWSFDQLMYAAQRKKK